MQTLTGHRGRVRSLSFSPDGRYLASAGGNGRAISLWDLHQRGRRRYLRGHETRVWAVAFVPTGSLLCSINGYGMLQGWNLASNQIVWSPPPIPVHDSLLAPDPRGRFLAVGGTTQYPTTYLVHLCPLPDVRPVERDPITGPDSLRSLAWSPDGGTLAVGRAGKAVSLHDRATGALRAELAHPAGVRAMAFAPDNRTLAVATGSSVVLWDLATNERRMVLRGHTGTVTGVGFTPDGRLLASAALDGQVKLWEASSGREHRAYDWGIGPLSALVLAADGLRGACGGEGGGLVVWDLED